ncbi:hypothetical protein [Isoptericola sp. NPDC055881]
MSTTEEEIAAYRAQHEADRLAARRQQHRDVSVIATAVTIAEARRMLPGIIARHGDTPDVQARRLDALEADTFAYDVGRPLRRAA